MIRRLFVQKKLATVQRIKDAPNSFHRSAVSTSAIANAPDEINSLRQREEYYDAIIATLREIPVNGIVASEFTFK